MKALVTGAWGQLGRALLRKAEERGFSFKGIDIEDADITDRASISSAVREAEPDWVIHCAARTDVDGCEGDPENAFLVNRNGALNTLVGARESGARFVLVSTDFVFDGTKNSPYKEEDPVNPLCVYAKSKEAGERACLSEWPEGTWVVRTQWLYGPWGRHFPRAIMRKAVKEGELKVVDDQVGCPTMTFDLADAIIDLCLSGAGPGIYHASNEGEACWFRFARAVLNFAGMEEIPVYPIKSSQLDLPAKRPGYSVLSKEKLRKAIGRPMRNWMDALKEYIQDLGGKEEAMEEEL